MMYIPFELQETMRRGECVLFVGAGLSEGLPNWKELMKPLAKELGINPDEDLLYIAEYYESEFGRPKLEEKIVKQVKKDQPLTKAHELLAKLPVKAIITTNYDHLLEKALSKKNFIKVVDGREAPLVKEDQLPLVKMHGDIDDPSTMVITKTDYNEYSEKHRALITYLLGFLISYTFLFVGFGLRDPNLDNIYYQMRSLFRDTQRKGYSIIKNPPDYEVKRLKRMGIEVIPIDDYNEISLIFEELAAICTEKIKVDMTPRQLESIQDTFREVVERQNKWLDPRGIFQFERMLTRREVELEEIYVVPRLVKQEVMRKRKERELEEEKKDEREQERALKDEIDTEEIEDYFIEKKVELTIKDALSDIKNSQMVILGDPGVGKSCLLQYIALKASTNVGESLGIEKQLLPVLIPLREYPQFGEKKMFKDFIFDYIEKQICYLPKNVLESFLERNSFFFLLDGLDEVVSESQRIEVSRQVERFMAQYPHMRIALTSRPAGYKPAALIGSIPHFTLADFNEDEIKEFLVKWFTFLDKIEEDKFDRSKTEKKAYDLADIILRREKILRLARNPLLLTILVLIHRVGRKLPERRAEFYDFAVKTITGSWETWKNLETFKDKELPDQEMTLALLENIGFRLHSEKLENIVGVEELKIWLKEAMEKEMGYSSPKKINSFLWMLKERAGLLVEKGLGLYGFVHLTFQEYFAARYMAVGRGTKLAGNLMRKYLYVNRWREVILLAAATAPPEQANLIFESVLENENPFEEYIHSNIMVAGLMLADLPRVNPLNKKDVIDKLCSFTSPGNVDLLRIDALKVLAEIGRTSSPDDVSWVVKLFLDKDWNVRREAVQYFTTLGKDDPEVSKEFFKLLHNEYSVVRQQAIEYFTTLGKDDPEAREEIFKLLRDKDSVVRQQAVQYFTTLGKDDPEVSKEFFKLLHNEYSVVRQQAVQYFTTLGKDDPEARDEIFNLLRDKDWDVRQQAIEYFTTLGKDDPEARDEIFNLLRDEDLDVRQQAVQYFATLGKDDPEARDEIFNLLRDKYLDVRQQAVQYFATLGTDDPEVSKRFFKLLRDENWDVCSHAVEYFTTLGKDDPEAREEIFNLLRNEYSVVRQQAVEYFTTLGKDDPEARDEIFNLLRDKYWDVRSHAIEYFTATGEDDPEVRDEIFRLLRDEDSNVRQQAVQYFATLGTDDPEVSKEFFELLRDETCLPSGRSIQDIAAEFLSQFAREESLKKAPNLFISRDLPTKRGAYKIMKELIQT